jgi:hypothetical protein
MADDFDDREPETKALDEDDIAMLKTYVCGARRQSSMLLLLLRHCNH